MDDKYIVVIERSKFEATMFMFHVPKGETDIRMVYDGSKSGLNDIIYAP